MQSMGHDLRRGLNNINPLGGNNYKTINKWLAEMKNIDSTLKTLDKETSADAKLIAAWGSTEGDDLADVCQRMSQLMEEVGLIQQAYSLRHVSYRKSIKSMKIQEMTLDENRKKKQDLTAQIAKLQKSSKDNPIKMMELQNALERVTAELLGQELDLMQFKRMAIKEAFDAKFDAMLEYAEKMALIAGYGRAITFVIDTDTQIADRMRIYNGSEYTAAAVSQVKTAVTNWQTQSSDAPPRPPPVTSQDELALSAAAVAYNTKTPPLSHEIYAANDGYTSGQNDASDELGDSGQISPRPSSDNASIFVPPPKTTHAQQLSQIQEQQRLLELEQQRLYQQNLASYSPEPSPAQQHYQVTAASGQDSGSSVASGGYTSQQHRRNNTQEIQSPSMLPVYEAGSSGTPSGYGHSSTSPAYGPTNVSPSYGGFSHQPYPYENNTYQGAGVPVRNYRLGFVDPRERLEHDRSKSELPTNGDASYLPPLHFSQSPILHEK